MALEEVGVKLLAENADRFDRDIKAATRALDTLTDTVQSGARDIDQGMGKSEKALESFADSAEKSFRRIDVMSEIVIGALRRVGEIAVNALLEAGKATADFLGDSVTLAGNFESTLNRFAAVTGDSLAAAGMDVEQFSDLFLEMGAVTQYSAQEAAEAAVNLAKGGIDPATIAAGGLAAALSLAAAGELDLAAAAEITAKQLGVWASTGITAADVADRMAQAANASTVDVDELALGLAQVGGVAKITGLSFDETTQAMALLAPGFSSASDAGTSFKMFLSGLVPTTEKAKDAMADLGLATSDGQSVFFDAQGNFIGMAEAAGLLAAATADLSEEETQLALKTIFGQDAIRAAALIAEQGAGGFNAMGEAMNAAGGAAEQAALRNQGYNFALEEMRGSMETLQIVLGGALLPLLTEFIQEHITPGINSLMGFAQAVLESETPMATLIAKIDELIPGFRGFIDTLVNIPTRVTEISDAFQNDFAPEIQLAKDVFETAMIVIESIVTSVVDAVMGAIDEFTSNLSGNSTTWSGLMRAFEGLWLAIEPIIGGILATLGALFLVFLGVATGVFTGILNAIEPFLAGLTIALDFITVALTGVKEFVMGFVDLIVALFQGNADGVLDAFKRMGTGVITYIIGIVGTVLALVGTMVATGLAFIEGFVLGIIEFFAGLFNDLVGHSIIPDLVNGILEWIGKLPTEAVAFISDMVTGVKDLFTNTDWGALGRGIIDGIIEGITGLAGSLADAARQAASDAYTAVTDFLGMESPSKLFMEVGEMTMAGMAIGIDDGAMQPIAALEGALEGLAMDLPSMLPQPVSATAQPGGNITNNYNGDTINQAPNYEMSIKTGETVGTIGGTIRNLQSISRIGQG